MSEQRRIVVLLVRHDSSMNPPAVADCMNLLSSGLWSIGRYWTDNTADWINFAAFDYFGWYDIQLPPPPDSRYTIRQRASEAAAARGVNLGAYDGYIILAFPG